MTMMTTTTMRMMMVKVMVMVIMSSKVTRAFSPAAFPYLTCSAPLFAISRGFPPANLPPESQHGRGVLWDSFVRPGNEVELQHLASLSALEESTVK